MYGPVLVFGSFQGWIRKSKPLWFFFFSPGKMGSFRGSRRTAPLVERAFGLQNAPGSSFLMRVDHPHMKKSYLGILRPRFAQV